MPSAFLGTSIVMSPERSPIGIAFISGLNIPLTSAVTIAVNAAPMIIPTATSGAGYLDAADSVPDADGVTATVAAAETADGGKSGEDNGGARYSV